MSRTALQIGQYVRVAEASPDRQPLHSLQQRRSPQATGGAGSRVPTCGDVFLSNGYAELESDACIAQSGGPTSPPTYEIGANPEVLAATTATKSAGP